MAVFGSLAFASAFLSASNMTVYLKLPAETASTIQEAGTMKGSMWAAVAFTAILASIGLLGVNQALADDCNGRWTNTTISSETLEVAKDHTVTFFVARGSATSDNSALNAVGECGGYSLTTPDGKVRWAGVCARKGKDGDSYSDVWSLEPGAERGVWKVVGATGSLAGKNFSGWWQPLIADGKSTTGIWGGTCQ